MRERVFEDHEEQQIDIYDVKVIFFLALRLNAFSMFQIWISELKLSEMRIPRNNINLLLYISFTIICSRFWFKTAITSKLVIIHYTLRKTASPQLIYLISHWLDLLMPLLSSWSFHLSARSGDFC